VLARVLAFLRRTPLPRITPFWVVFRSLFPSILCFCEGRSRAGTSNDAGFKLLVRLGNRLHAGDPTPDELLVDDRTYIPNDGHCGPIDGRYLS
jgi:hypothetical protein